MSIQREATYKVEDDEFSTAQLDARPESETPTAVLSGWEAANELNLKSDFPKEFKFIEGEYQILKFLDQDGPFAVYKQHFIDRIKTGKRSFISLGMNDPLCTILGSKPEEKRAFSVVNLSAPGGPQRQMLIASPRLYKILHAAHFSPAGPLTRNYWAITRTGSMQTVNYPFNPVKGRDLAEDWNIVGIDEEAIANMAPFTRADIKESTWEELEAIAKSLV